jgi:hypothetical protein
MGEFPKHYETADRRHAAENPKTIGQQGKFRDYYSVWKNLSTNRPSQSEKPIRKRAV